MMKKALTILAVTAFFFGCEQPTKTVVQEVNSVKVGDELSGGFVVTIADATTGYLATRDVDFNNDGDFTDVGDKQGLVYGKGPLSREVPVLPLLECWSLPADPRLTQWEPLQNQLS